MSYTQLFDTVIEVEGTEYSPRLHPSTFGQSTFLCLGFSLSPDSSLSDSDQPYYGTEEELYVPEVTQEGKNLYAYKPGSPLGSLDSICEYPASSVDRKSVV